VPGTEPPIRLLALDARERSFTLRGITAPSRRADGTVGGTPMPFWIAEADTGTRHDTTSGGSGGHDDGSTTWNASLEPAFADDARSLPDLVSTPVTRAGALHATVALRPDRG
jgi:hypothetical protein